MNKQIDEMARDICHVRTCEVKKNGGTCYKHCKAYIYAFRAINAGYRKQVEGEWRNLAKVGVYMCTACTQLSPQPYPYCPKCGAKMKGESDERAE